EGSRPGRSARDRPVPGATLMSDQRSRSSRSTTLDLACRDCGEPAAKETAFVARYGERRPCVSPAAKAFTCSRCLLAGPVVAALAGPVDQNSSPCRGVAGQPSAPSPDPHKDW